MRVLSNQQAKAWCETRGVHTDIESGLVSLRYAATGHQCLQAAFPKESPQLIAMAHALLLQDLAEPDAQDFTGALVWLRDWDIWSEASEKAGCRMLELLRAALVGDEAPTIRDAPAHLFSPQEFVDAHLLLTIPLIFQWDAYVIPVSARCFTLVSHEARVRIATRSNTILSRISERFEVAHWNPERCPPSQYTSEG